jgi:hypothetical protein
LLALLVLLGLLALKVCKDLLEWLVTKVFRAHKELQERLDLLAQLALKD